MVYRDSRLSRSLIVPEPTIFTPVSASSLYMGCSVVAQGLSNRLETLPHAQIRAGVIVSGMTIRDIYNSGWSKSPDRRGAATSAPQHGAFDVLVVVLGRSPRQNSTPTICW